MNKKKLIHKYFFVFVNVSIYLFLIHPMKTKYLLNIDHRYDKNRLFSNEINYKGEIISKEKLLNDYLSKISNEFRIEKEYEKKMFNQYFYLADYSNIPIIKTKLKKEFLKVISKKKNQTITELDVFFLSRIYNFGNNLLTINNAIFYCEIVGCHNIVLFIQRIWYKTRFKC